MLLELWKSFNKLLNDYGDLIGFVSLIFSIIVFVKTEQIKNNIKNLLNHKDYEKIKGKVKNKLEGIVDSIKKDNIFDNALVGEILKEISTLSHYSIYFDKRTTKDINTIEKLLANDISEINSGQLYKELNKIIGDLSVNNTYLG